MRQSMASHICPDSRLVVVELGMISSIEHTEYLQNIRVGVGSRELVSSPIEAEHEFAPMTWTTSKVSIISNAVRNRDTVPAIIDFWRNSCHGGGR